jgi:hypothetical protein
MAGIIQHAFGTGHGLAMMAGQVHTIILCFSNKFTHSKLLFSQLILTLSIFFYAGK